MGIVAVLAGMWLGPAARILGKARAMQWADQATRHTGAIRQQLHKVLVGQKQFSRLTIEAMESSGWISAAQGRFLRDRRVHFTPFSGTDAEELPVIVVDIQSGLLTSSETLAIKKGELTSPGD